MEPIYPLTEENLNQFCGQPVCVVMKDGTRHVGILSRCRGGRLVLNDDAPEAYGSAAGQHEAEGKRRSRRRAGSRKNGGTSAGKAQASAFGSFGWYGPPGYDGPFSGGYRPPYGFFGPRILLDLALIALVLLIL